MKKQLTLVVNALISSKFFKATAIVMILSGASCLNAQSIASTSSYASQTESGVKGAEIKHLETVNSMMVFQVKLDNVSGKRFTLRVKDGEGSSLFTGSFTDKNFLRTFKVPTGESDKVIFVIKSDGGYTSQTFKVSSSIRYVEEVTVTKVI